MGEGDSKSSTMICRQCPSNSWCLRSRNISQRHIIYIYIYGRGRRFPERTSIRIIELEKNRVLLWQNGDFSCRSFHCWCLSITDHFFSSVEVEVNYGPSQYVFFGVLIFSIGITRCAFCAISKIIGKGYNILCFHRYFDVMLFFIGNSQWFCISSKFPSAVSQLFFLFLYKSISTRHINHYRRHKPDQFKCYSMQEDTIVEH